MKKAPPPEGLEGLLCDSWFSAQADTTAPPTLKPYQYQNDAAAAVEAGRWLEAREKVTTDGTIAEFLAGVKRGIRE